MQRCRLIPAQRLRSADHLSASAPRRGRPGRLTKRAEGVPIERYAAPIDRLAHRLEDVVLTAAAAEA